VKPACKGRFFFLSRLSANQVGQPSEGEGRGNFAVSESLERGFQFCLTGYQEHGRKKRTKARPKTRAQAGWQEDLWERGLYDPRSDVLDGSGHLVGGIGMSSTLV